VLVGGKDVWLSRVSMLGGKAARTRWGRRQLGMPGRTLRGTGLDQGGVVC